MIHTLAISSLISRNNPTKTQHNEAARDQESLGKMLSRLGRFLITITCIILLLIICGFLQMYEESRIPPESTTRGMALLPLNQQRRSQQYRRRASKYWLKRKFLNLFTRRRNGRQAFRGPPQPTWPTRPTWPTETDIALPPPPYDQIYNGISQAGPMHPGYPQVPPPAYSSIFVQSPVHYQQGWESRRRMNSSGRG
jgi:hypothetical protein